MGNTFEYRGYTFLKIKSNIKERPYRVKCLQTLEEKDSGCSYEAAADLIISPMEFAQSTLKLNSQDINYVKKIFENRLLGKKKSECDNIVENDICHSNLIDGDIFHYNDTERFAEQKIYRTNHFEIKVLFERGLMFGATKIIVIKV